jgi:hypothetical protein
VRRNWLFLALLVSVGINCGLLGMGLMRHRMLAGSDRSDRFERAERGERLPGRQGVRLADRLDLEGVERERFLGLQRTLAETVHAGRLRIDDSRRELRRELTSPDPDRDRVETLLNGIGKEQDALDRALVENVFAARDLLEGEAEREYLRFVERFGGAFAGRSPGPGGPGGMRPRFGDRRLRAPDGSPGPADSDGADGSGDSDDPARRRGPDSPR